MIKRELIHQPYALTQARYESNIHMERVIDVLLDSLKSSMVYKSSDSPFGNRVFSIRTKDMLPKGSRNYKFLRDALRFLKSKEIMVKGADKKGEYELFTGIILQFKYYSNNECVDIEISSQVLNFLLNNQNGYTKYNLDVSFGSSSSYTARLYKMISHWRDKMDGFIMPITVDHLRKILCLGEKYKRANDVRKSVLIPCIKYLKSKGDLWFDIKEPIKEGRKVVGWKISIHKRQESKKHNQALPQASSPEDKKLLDRLVNVFHLSEGQSRKVVAKVDHTKLEKELEKISVRIKKGELKNVGGYSFKVLAEQFDINIGKKTPSKTPETSKKLKKVAIDIAEKKVIISPEELLEARKSFEAAKLNSQKPSKTLKNGAFTKKII